MNFKCELKHNTDFLNSFLTIYQISQWNISPKHNHTLSGLDPSNQHSSIKKKKSNQLLYIHFAALCFQFICLAK